MPDTTDQSPAQLFVGFTADTHDGHTASGNVILAGVALPTNYEELHAIGQWVAQHNDLAKVTVLSLCPLPAVRPVESTA